FQKYEALLRAKINSDHFKQVHEPFLILYQQKMREEILNANTISGFATGLKRLWRMEEKYKEFIKPESLKNFVVYFERKKLTMNKLYGNHLNERVGDLKTIVSLFRKAQAPLFESIADVPSDIAKQLANTLSRDEIVFVLNTLIVNGQSPIVTACSWKLLSSKNNLKKNPGLAKRCIMLLFAPENMQKKSMRDLYLKYNSRVMKVVAKDETLHKYIANFYKGMFSKTEEVVLRKRKKKKKIKIRRKKVPKKESFESKISGILVKLGIIMIATAVFLTIVSKGTDFFKSGVKGSK
ncbi:hypothetical protein ACFLZV_04030, partial [Candidatus Margulisiibacteriota bacterium]